MSQLPIPHPNHESHILVTTHACFEPSTIINEFGLIAAEIIYARKLPQSTFPSEQQQAEFIAEFQLQSKNAKNDCLMALRKKAFKLGANAVIQVDLDFTEFSQSHLSSILIVSASGSAVNIVK